MKDVIEGECTIKTTVKYDGKEYKHEFKGEFSKGARDMNKPIERPKPAPQQPSTSKK